jgi:DMSO/TMAO reductase YedYZ molybdopterin-dependent catalytic subunit
VGQVGTGRRSSRPDLRDPLDLLDPPNLPNLPDLRDPPDLPDLPRRKFLSSALLLPTLFLQTSSARFIAAMPLGNPGGAAPPPFGRLLGDGLDARQFTDLSRLGSAAGTVADPLRTETSDFFIRTAAPSNLPPADSWTIHVAGQVATPLDLRLRDLETHAAPARRALIECSGNADQSNYGLMSTADWEGIPIGAILDRVKPSAGGSRILVSGVDDDTRAWRTSLAGASWIFTRDQLQQALLALRMNNAPLARDHGFPARLIVPGWYGCSCIKWVNRIELVADEAPATLQMREFAARTHQPFDPSRASGSPRASSRGDSLDGLSSLAVGYPLLARDFIPATIDTAAMPVRVEKWIAGGRIEYRLAGIIWGGSTPTNALQIRFKTGEPWVAVDNCPLPASTLTWSLWSHTWRPSAPGRYQIVCRIADPSIRTRRLDLFFYVREIVIDET